MKAQLLLLAGICAIAIAAPAHGQDTSFRVILGGTYHIENTKVEGSIFGSLAPSTPFRDEDEGQRAEPTASLSFDRNLGDVFFLGAEIGVELGELDQLFTASASASASQQVVRCFPPPPLPGVPPFCVPFGTFTRTFTEQQDLNLHVESGPSAALLARAGMRFGRSRAWAFGGLAIQRTRISYALPTVSTVMPPVQPFVIIGLPPLQSEESSLPPTVVLPAELRAASQQLVGWSAGIGLEHRVSSWLSILIRYAYADYGSATFTATPRLAPIRIEQRSHAFNLALAFGF